jgi:hypothetical protein
MADFSSVKRNPEPARNTNSRIPMPPIDKGSIAATDEIRNIRMYSI